MAFHDMVQKTGIAGYGSAIWLSRICFRKLEFQYGSEKWLSRIRLREMLFQDIVNRNGFRG